MKDALLSLNLSRMKKIITLVVALWMSASTFAQEDAIQWMSFEEAVAANDEGANKPIFIDVYTDWCGWCKRLDATTFKDPRVVEYMNDTYLNVKLDGEERETIVFRDQEFNYVASGRRGYNELPAALLNGRLSYPTVVFLNAEFENLSPVPGYQPADQFLQIAKFFGDGHYLDTPWEDYVAREEARKNQVEEMVEDGQ